MMPTRDEILKRLDKVLDPELHQPITSLGMIEGIRVADGRVRIDVKLTVQGCPLQDRIDADIRHAMEGLDLRELRIELGVMTTEERQKLAQMVRPVRESSVTRKDSTVRVLIVGSGKGGVGKSTVTVNLAAALQDMGRNVAVLDADVYGFSVPRMIGVRRAPVVLSEDLILPAESGGVKVISMGMLVGEDTPVMWRGPMLTKLIEQFLGDVVWGDDLEYLVVDAPPGTGDVAITLAQRLHQGKIVLVTTPQAAAARVAIRVAQMSKKVGQDVLGVVENMAYFRCPTCGEETAIFGAGGGEALARELAVPLLGRLPIDAELPEGGDEGRPAVWERPEGEPSRIFREIAREIDAHRSWPRALPSPTGTL